jgi:hypothetical protein
MKQFTRTVVLGGVLLLVAAPVAAQSVKSLAKCEKMLAKETTKLARGIQNAVGKCMDKIVGEQLAKGDPVSDAAKACASSLRKLENSEDSTKTLAAKFAVNAAKACDPTAPNTKAEHTAAEALDPNDPAGPQAGVLGAYCSGFGGDGALDDIGEWIECATQAALCSALQQVAVAYPRAAEWIGQVATDIAALGAEAKYTDAATVASALLARLDGDMDGVADIACGGASRCGDGVINGAEDCDFGTLNGKDCTDFGSPFGDLSCGAGCRYDTSECASCLRCESVDDWSNNPVPDYEEGAQVKSNGNVYSCKQFPYSGYCPQYDPAGEYGVLGWTYVAPCCL